MSSMKEKALEINTQRVKAHLYIRLNLWWLSAEEIVKLNDLFLTEDMRAFWQKAHLTGWLHNTDALEPMYNACQEFWFGHNAEFGRHGYMDVMRWKLSKDKISFDEFRQQMLKSYKACHAQQMRRWREKATALSIPGSTHESKR